MAKQHQGCVIIFRNCCVKQHFSASSFQEQSAAETNSTQNGHFNAVSKIFQIPIPEIFLRDIYPKNSQIDCELD